ncbi:hypothetical protein BC835DRAFT_1103844 [Cytidiella melzeri]|nr:hypothetical protein BC835DRAFT_1103844 [Cytidiella melzeri]
MAQDDNLKSSYTLQDRLAILSAARQIWSGTNNTIALLETLHVSNLEYWPIRDSVLLRKVVNSTHPDVVYDLSQISSALNPSSSTTVLSHWQIRLQKETGSVACVDVSQDLLVVRHHGPVVAAASGSDTTVQWYSLAIHSLRTGQPHPRAKHSHVQFKMSQRVAKNPHYTRVQVLDNILAVNMASGFQLFTETTFFDWTTGEQKAVFCSPGASARAWGHPAVLISERCFLQPCYSTAERRPAIEVYVLDEDSVSADPDPDGYGRPATHVATYWLPRVLNGDVRLIINAASRQQVSPNDSDEDDGGGFLISSASARMLHVQVAGVWFTSPFQCAFFTPAHQFIDESERFLALPRAHKRTWVGPRDRPWSTWGNHSTRWLEKDGPAWHEEAKSNLRGSGSRYAFPDYLVDFSPADIAREVHQYQQQQKNRSSSSSSSRTGVDLDMPSTSTSTTFAFASTVVAGWTTHFHVATKTEISGAEMFEEDTLLSALPYRQKRIAELPEYELGSDVLLVNDKIVSVQGGVLDSIKIYAPLPVRDSAGDEELVDALEGLGI